MSSNFDIYQVLLAPVITEKCTMGLEQANQQSFKVATWANKPQIKAAVEKLFNVHVQEIQTMNVQGKNKRFGRVLGRRQDWKKAVVRLKEGETIDFFAK
ncbi:MAG: 50S ribosomal protein L23 [Magnetococcales bacterium]|nr:50S ribosomal protein L23 [Magnetococcales bacterium]